MVVLKLGTPFDYKGIFSPSERNEGESIVVGDHVANERETAKGGEEGNELLDGRIGPKLTAIRHPLKHCCMCQVCQRTPLTLILRIAPANEHSKKLGGKE